MRSNSFTSFLIPVFVAVFSSSFCQENYLPGYVIRKGDTLQGFIDYRNWRMNPDVISFRRDPDGERNLFAPLDVEGFAVHDERYVSAIVQTDVSPMPFERQGDEGSPEPELVTDTTFLQTLILGPKSLYYYVNALGRDQFYIGSNSGYVLLTYRKYVLTIRGTKGIFENNLYRGQLIAYLQDCPAVRNNMKSARYAQGRLERIFRSYYDCTGSTLAFERKMEKTIVDLGAVTGLTSTRLSVTGISYLDEADMPSSVDVPVALYIEIIPARNQRKWSLYNEIAYSSYEVTGTYHESPNRIPSTVYRSTLGASYVKLNNMVRFKYRIRNFFAFVNAGVSNGISVSETNSLVKEITSYSGEREERGEVFTEMRKHEQGYLVGLGAKRGRLSFEARMEKANGMSPFPRVGTATTRYFFLVSYRIY